MKSYLASMSRVETAEFEITGIEEIAGSTRVGTRRHSV